MLQIPDSAAIAGSRSLVPKQGWVHAGTKCSACSLSPIVGDRYMCSTCACNVCAACVQMHPTNHALVLYQQPLV